VVLGYPARPRYGPIFNTMTDRDLKDYAQRALNALDFPWRNGGAIALAWGD